MVLEQLRQMAHGREDSSGINGSGEGKRFVRLLMANQGRIYGYILTLVPSWPDADDIMQETAEVMWTKFAGSEPINNFVSWGIRIAQNKIFNYYSRKNKSEILLDGEFLEDIAHRASVTATAADERIKILQQCLSRLNERDRRLIQIKYEQNITIRRLAEVVQRPVQGLYKVMGRIHNTLLECVRLSLAREDIS